MSLKVNLRHLEAHELHLKGELSAEQVDFDLHDEMMAVEAPLQYDLRVESVAQSILVQGKLALTLHCQCVRCLRPFDKPITLDNWTLHLPLEGEEAVHVDNDCVDLTPYAREDMLLEFPQHPLCGPNCPGLGNNRRDSGQKSASAWNELDKLDF